MNVGGIKRCVGALAMFCAASFAEPAIADPVWVSNVQVSSSLGVFNFPEASITGGYDYYAGLIDFTVNPGTSYDPTTTYDLFVFCDDLFNEVGVGSSEQYQLDSPGALTGGYFNGLSTTTIEEIAGLAYDGFLNQTDATGNPTLYEDLQLAIWKLEYPSDVTLSGTTLANVDGLIGDSLAYYNEMGTSGYWFGELESPCPGATPTYNSGCQIQGQIYIYNNGSPVPSFTPVPEAGTLSVLAMGLLGLGVWLRRKDIGQGAL